MIKVSNSGLTILSIRSGEIDKTQASLNTKLSAIAIENVEKKICLEKKGEHFTKSI